MLMFYVSAGVAILGTVGYQFFIKRVPETINPIVSVMGMYVSVLALGVIMLLFYPGEGGFRSHLRQLSWIQIALAGTVMMIELGFLMMYRYGWNLSTGNLVTGVFVNIILVVLGVTLLAEKMNVVNAVGIGLSILGVALISYRP
jgi:drug/metabolite transporter (DMT)-like permease